MQGDKTMKRYLSLFCCAALAASAFSSGGCAGKKTEIDYDVPDVTMENCLLNTEELFSVLPETDFVVSHDERVDGYMMTGAETSFGTSSAFFWIGKPEGEMPDGGFPAVLLLHGGGGNAFTEWVKHWLDLGYVALAIDLNGQRFDEDGFLVSNPYFYHSGSWGSVGCGTDEKSFRDSWTGVNLTHCVLAHNYLRSLSFVNPEKTVATGISWGGYLTCMLAGIDKRFRAFAPVYGCGSLTTDSWGLSTAGLSSLDEKGREEWEKVYDPLSYLPYATRPMLFVAGMTDHAFSCVSRKKSTELVKGKTFFAYSSSLEHGHYFGITPSVDSFFGKVLAREPLAASFADWEVREGKLFVKTRGVFDYVSLSYTVSEEEDSHLWSWSNKEVVLQEGENEIVLPENATAVLLTGYGAGPYAEASTDVVFLKDISLFR